MTVCLRSTARSATRRSTTLAPTARAQRPAWLPAWCRAARTSRAPARRCAEDLRGAAHHSTARARVLSAAPALLRLAHQLTGDQDAAVATVVAAIARRPTVHAHSDEVVVDEQLTRELVRGPHPQPPPPRAPE